MRWLEIAADRLQPCARSGSFGSAASSATAVRRMLAPGCTWPGLTILCPYWH